MVWIISSLQNGKKIFRRLKSFMLLRIERERKERERKREREGEREGVIKRDIEIERLRARES